MTYPPQQGQPGSAIALTARFLPLAFFFSFVKPVIEINGYRVPAVWGRNMVPVPPGRHQVHVHTPYFLPSQVGPADVTVDVAPGQLVELEPELDLGPDLLAGQAQAAELGAVQPGQDPGRELGRTAAHSLQVAAQVLDHGHQLGVERLRLRLHALELDQLGLHAVGLALLLLPG